MPVSPDRLTVYSRPGCIDCDVVYEVLARWSVPHIRINILDNAVAQTAMLEANGGVESVPTIVFHGDGTVLVEPTAEAFELALKESGIIY